MKTKSLVNAAIMLAVYMVFFVLYNIGVLPTIMSILLPIPLIVYSVTTNRVRDVLWLLIGCFIGTFLFGSVYGLVTTLNYGLMGALIGIGIIKKWPYWQRLLNAAIVSVISFPILTYVVTGLNLQESMAQMADEMNGMLESMSAFLSDTVATSVLKRMNYEVTRRGSIHRFQLGAKLAVTLLISQVAIVFIPNHALNVVLMNVIMLLNTLFLLQGIVVAMSYFRSCNKRGFGTFIIIFALMSSFSMFISVLGVMDALFDYRERFAVKKS